MAWRKRNLFVCLSNAHFEPLCSLMLSLLSLPFRLRLICLYKWPAQACAERCQYKTHKYKSFTHTHTHTRETYYLITVHTDWSLQTWKQFCSSQTELDINYRWIDFCFHPLGFYFCSDEQKSTFTATENRAFVNLFRGEGILGRSVLLCHLLCTALACASSLWIISRRRNQNVVTLNLSEALS